MAFDAIAYAPDELSLLTIDGVELLSHDAQTETPKWRLSFDHPLVAVLFVDPHALPGAQGSNPWRTQSSGRAVLVLDAEGNLALVDSTLGQVIGRLPSPAPFGKPLAVASSTATGALALAMGDSVLYWRNGERRELRLRASALAFSNDGETLAVGTSKGELVMFTVAAAPAETFRHALGGGVVVDLAQHPGGLWIVLTAQGAFQVGPSGATRLPKIVGGSRRVRFDANGGRVAVQHAERAIAVYQWPNLSVEMRVEYTDRPVRGLAWGPANWLGVGLDHGDGNKIDVVTSATNRTDTHAGRQHRSWSLLVEGKREILAAKDLEDVKRMHETPPSSSKLGRLGIGGGISIALIVLRVCVRVSTPSPSIPDYKFNPPNFGALGTPGARGCDRSCAEARLKTLQAECVRTPTLGCSADAAAAVSAFNTGRCSEAKAAVGRIVPTAEMKSRALLLDVERLLAKMGLDEACAAGAIRPMAVRHAELVHLTGAALTPTVEKIPELRSARGEVPRALWAAPDGTVFVVTGPSQPASEQSSLVYRRSKSGEWDSARTIAGTANVSLAGKSSSDVYVSTSTSMIHFDGSTWSLVTTPAESKTVATTVAGGEVFLAATVGLETQIHVRHGSQWVKQQPLGQDPESDLVSLHGGPGLWALANDQESNDVLFQRTPSGMWSVRTPANDAGTTTIHSVWVSPTGDAFIAGGDEVLRSAGANRWTRLSTPSEVRILWGRTSSDVFGGDSSGLVHFDGKKWTATSYSDGVLAISGTSTEVLVARTSE